MKEKISNILHLLIIGILFFVLSGYNQHTYKNKIISETRYNTNYKSQHQKNIQNKQKNIKTPNHDQNLLHNKNMTIPSLFNDNYSFSKIQIDNTSLNTLNISLKKYEQKLLTFNQLGIQLSKEKKIYNFCVGYRYDFYNQCIIGNNICYDTMLSSDGKKILSIGNEFFKNSIHITNNLYYNCSVKNFQYTYHKRYIPYAYDIRSIIPLSSSNKLHGKINFEHYSNDKKNTSLYKLTLGISYNPISIFTFNIDKTIFNFKKNTDTKFHISVNYKIDIPWLYQIQDNRCKKNTLLMNKYYSIVNRNNKIPFKLKNNNLHKIQIYTSTQSNSKKTQPIKNNIIIKKYNSKKNYKQKKTKYYQKEKRKIPNKNLLIHPSANKNIKNILLDKNTSIIIVQSPINSQSVNPVSHTKLITSTHKKKKNNIHTHFYKYYNKFTSTHNDVYPTTSTTYNKKKYTNYVPKNKIQLQKINTLPSNVKKQKNSHHNNNTDNIPIPPPIFDLLKQKNKEKNSKKNENNTKNYINNNDNQMNTQNSTQEITKHKKNNFSSIGTHEHLSKLNSLNHKRKKTISSSSNESNTSETTTLLKIMERHNALTTNTDTDSSDDKHSTISNNEFSDF